MITMLGLSFNRCIKLMRFLVHLCVAQSYFYLRLSGLKLTKTFALVYQEWAQPAVTITPVSAFNNIKTNLRRASDGSQFVNQDNYILLDDDDDDDNNCNTILIKDESKLLSRFSKPLGKVYYFSYLFYWMSFIKYVLILLLNLNIFQEYQFMDCFLLGRFTLNPRTINAAKYFAFGLIVFHLLWRMQMVCSKFHNFKFDFVEFLLHDYSEILAYELNQHWNGHKKATGPPTSNTTYRNTFHNSLLGTRFPTSGAKNTKREKSTQITYNSIFHYEDWKISEGAIKHGVSFRPNRTTKAFRNLLRLTLYYNLFHLVFWLILTPITLGMGLRMNLSKRGLELDYFNCCQWLRSHPNSTLVKHLYEPIHSDNHNDTSLFFLPMDASDFKDINLYRVLVVVANIIENSFLYLDTYIAFVQYSYFIVLISQDTYNYWFSIREQLLVIAKKLKTKDGGTIGVAKGPIKSHYDESLMNDVHSIQSQIIDNFKLVGRYNEYVSFYVTWCVVIWITFSIAICGALLVPDTNQLMVEWYWLQTYVSLFLLYIFIGITRANSLSFETHKLMNNLMSRDDFHRSTKKRWVAMSRYYQPFPLDAFSMFRHVRITPMLVAQVSI